MSEASGQDFEIAQQLGELRADARAMVLNIKNMDAKLDKHIEDEEGRLKRIEEQLSLTRFIWLVLKAMVLTVAFILAFKFGDIRGLWDHLK